MSFFTSLGDRFSLLLLFGYVRNNYCNKVPIVLIKLCCNFYDETVYWDFGVSGDNQGEFTITDFYNCKNQDEIIGKPFTIEDIVFQLSLSPNGWTHDSKGYIQLYFEIKQVPVNVSNIGVYYVLHCTQTNYEYKGCELFDFPSNSLSTGWPKFTTKLSNHLNLKTINFVAYVDLLHIKYSQDDKSPNKPKYWFKSINVPKEINFEWEVTNKLLNEWKTCEYGRANHSVNFGNECWCLRCVPNGGKPDNKGKCYLVLKLLRIPYDVKLLTVQYTLKCSYHYNNGSNIIEYKDRKQFGYTEKYGKWDEDLLSTETLKKVKNITFSCHIKIVDKLLKDEFNSFD